ncbi:hypothetical protein AMTRI_Chr01g129660 [Amborella trichopoda]|uniref:translation initiation factor eIF-2B subunit beta isoform X2 n=1 Tax=Amborella trichopoda TaxID=13333 RepID=UPI0005D34182|nr:translation initiation factor eIF-2B subunit beta isoform X2 [Amborella trichopoda]|eukprot:XP_011629406.1 translation initiation factor eIF-2B subunit beta isoform X2 [Amborella trichopoda]
MPDVQASVNELISKLKRRQVEGSHATAKETAILLRTVVSQHRGPNANQASSFIDAVKAVGSQLITANPVELAVGNIVRRVLHIIREEDLSLATTGIGGLSVSAGSDDDDETDRNGRLMLSAASVAAASRSALRAPSLHTLLEDLPDQSGSHHTSSSGGDSEGKSKSADKNSKSWKLKQSVIEAINELIEDIDNCHAQIAEQALEHIHQKYQGHVLAKELVAKDLQTTVITDSAVFAMISRVNMVIVGAHAIMANGGIIAPVGLNMVALAAKRHAVPFVVVAGSHKLCPLYPHNPEVLLNDLKSPSDLLDFGEFSDCMDYGSGNGAPLLHVVNPTFDYVPPQLVSLFITDTGGHNPSYMYRLIADYYSADDLVVQQQRFASRK